SIPELTADEAAEALILPISDRWRSDWDHIMRTPVRHVTREPPAASVRILNVPPRVPLVMPADLVTIERPATAPNISTTSAPPEYDATPEDLYFLELLNDVQGSAVTVDQLETLMTALDDAYAAHEASLLLPLITAQA